MNRRIDLDGCFNFRDLGGYPGEGGKRIRWRRLFRSDALHHLTAADADRVVYELAVGHIVDLRSTAELEAEGRGPLGQRAPRFHHVPLFDGDTSEGRAQAEEFTLADRYFLMAEFAREPIARVIDTLAGSNAPAVYHCAAGKDRTGVISAILLGLLGVHDELIVIDYAASQEQLDSIIDRLLETEGYQEMFEQLPPDTLHAQPETMVSLLERIRERYGDMTGYAREIGISERAVDRLRSSLLE
ncbi:MAG: tyrosine-protein phosphatase [Myxococcota bacterium]